MAQRIQIVAELKRALRARGITYAQVARHLELSEASVKRLFAAGDFSLERLDRISFRRFLRNGARPEQFDFIVPNAWAYRSVDLRVEKQFRVGGSQRVSVAFEGVNVFSFDNFTDYDGFRPPEPRTNAMFGRPRNLIDPGRRLQFGLRYGF